MTGVRIVLCGCTSCPVRDSGFTSYQTEALCLGPWMVVEGCPARLLGLPGISDADLKFLPS